MKQVFLIVSLVLTFFLLEQHSKADDCVLQEETTAISAARFLHDTEARPAPVKFRSKRSRRHKLTDFSLWIDQQQIKSFSGYLTTIYVISNGHVMSYILDPKFEHELPVIPYEVDQVNFTWSAGRKKYFYEFFNLISEDTNSLRTPIVSINKKGKIPRKVKSFSIDIKCVHNTSGIIAFSLGLKVWRKGGQPLADTPLTLNLKKQCLFVGSIDVSCDEKCGPNGLCDGHKKCVCREGYLGATCQNTLCYPQCKNGGICTSPGRCTCPRGYQGRYCEGGMCVDKCLNGGRCVQKDTCSCRKGFYGNRCEFSKCVIPCINGGKCRGVNKCKCPRWYSGDHCQIVSSRKLQRKLKMCRRKCKNGSCSSEGGCVCSYGYSGKWCRRKKRGRKNRVRKERLWV